MEERRKSKRIELEATLRIKPLNVEGNTNEVTVNISNVSKSGVGFVCDEVLTIGAIYEANLQIWTKEVLHAFIEIVRIEKVGDTYEYGSFFVGMPGMDAYRIAVYETVTSFENGELK